jgi:hypothetical protein
VYVYEAEDRGRCFGERANGNRVNDALDNREPQSVLLLI